MKHLPFEDWLLGEETLTPVQQQALDEHLRDCPPCQALQNGLKEVESLFRSSGLHDPAPGFVERWQARARREMVARQQVRYHWQVGIVLILTLTAVVGMAMLLRGQLLGTFVSWVDVVVAVFRLFEWFFALGALQRLFAVVWRTLGGLVPAGGWVLAAAVLGLGSLVWLGWLARLIKFPRRIGA